ncbi:hypothetical protein M569_05497, partial [Genlisea aurea]
MDVERSSLCNCVVNFLLEENYLLSAFELLHELLDDGRDDQAIRLKEFFSDPAHFPPDQITRLNSLKFPDPQSLFEDKQSMDEKLAVRDYELRLALEDIQNLKAELLKKSGTTNWDELNEIAASDFPILKPEERDQSHLDLGPLKDNERFDINCAVKEYLLLAGYRLTAMTFYEEVTGQNLDVWQNSAACVSDALRHYYYQYLSSTGGAAEEKVSMLREIECLLKEKDELKNNVQSLTKSKESSETKVMALTKSLELIQKDIKEKEITVQNLKKNLERKRKEINDCRAEITSLKVRMEDSLSGKNALAVDSAVSQAVGENNENSAEISQNGFGSSNLVDGGPIESTMGKEFSVKATELDDPRTPDNTPSAHGPLADLATVDTELSVFHGLQSAIGLSEEQPEEALTPSGDSNSIGKSETMSSLDIDSPVVKTSNADSDPDPDPNSAKIGLEAIQILSDALPKIVPYVLINHREELLPLIMCAIERHPDSSTRDSLTHTLFNLIKRPDEQQRQIIMAACVTLAKNVGELRTEIELLPQCWEQINHMYEERRLLVAQSCGELAQYVRPEIRDSLILSIVQQLVEDSATVVREAAARNLALLLTLFPSTEKYFKVEDLMFQLVYDPSGMVVETAMKDLVPALIKWGDKLDHILNVLLSHLIQSVQQCPPMSGVDGSLESHLHVLAERERWNIDVLLRLLVELLSHVHRRAVETCPLTASIAEEILFNESLLESYARRSVDWPAFEWLHVECFPTLIQLSSMLPRKEDGLRNCIVRFLRSVVDYFGEHYSTNIMLPVFQLAVGEDVDLKSLPYQARKKLIGLKPQSAVARRLAQMAVLPLLLAGVLGHPTKHNELAEHLRSILIHRRSGRDDLAKHEIINAVRFFSTCEENQGVLFSILWEMVANSGVDPKVAAANLLKAIVPYTDEKAATAHVLPALVTLGSDPNLDVKYASIDAFGSVAQHFKNDMIIDKIRVQMDAFLEDGSHEATVAVIRALLIAVPHTKDSLRDYILFSIYTHIYLYIYIFKLSASPPPPSSEAQRRERANAFCESIRALDATELGSRSVKEFLIPAIQNVLMREGGESLDPAHREALEIIMKERSGAGRSLGGGGGKVTMGSHLVSSLFGESGLLGRGKAVEAGDGNAIFEGGSEGGSSPTTRSEETTLRRIMRGGFTDMLRGGGRTE